MCSKKRRNPDSVVAFFVTVTFLFLLFLVCIYCSCGATFPFCIFLFTYIFFSCFKKRLKVKSLDFCLKLDDSFSLIESYYF